MLQKFQFDHEIDSVLFILSCAGPLILQQPPLILFDLLSLKLIIFQNAF